MRAITLAAVDLPSGQQPPPPPVTGKMSPRHHPPMRRACSGTGIFLVAEIPGLKIFRPAIQARIGCRFPENGVLHRRLTSVLQEARNT